MLEARAGDEIESIPIPLKKRDTCSSEEGFGTAGAGRGPPGYGLRGVALQTLEPSSGRHPEGI